MAKRTVLICDDNARDAESLQYALTVEGYNVFRAGDGSTAKKLLADGGIDLVVLEAKLPDSDGFELCRSIRGASAMPVIFLSSRSDELDRVLGLKIGADDYITKPFSAREVVARVEAVLRRCEPGSSGLKGVHLGGVTIFPDSYSMYVENEKISLIASDFKLLYYMLSNAGKVMTREKMLDAVWGYDYYGNQRSVDTQIKRIRAALKDKNVQFAIHSVYGVGYKLELTDKNCPEEKNSVAVKKIS